MNRTDAIAWVVSVCAVTLRLSQAKTLSILVSAAMRVQRVSLGNIGRNMDGTAKHQIKRCWRFCNNDRVETADAMRGVVGKILRKRKKPLLVALDWVDVRNYQTLMASAVMKGRSVPICWASCEKHVYDGHKSRNAFEESLLLVLASMVPQGQKVILLADRGFGRTELARFCQRQGFDYIIRIQPKVQVRVGSFKGNLVDYPVHKGICKLLRDVDYRQKDGVQQNIVVRWVRNLPKNRDGCWFLMTSLKARPGRISDLYARRMTTEQLFRDQKNKLNGWSLRDTQLKTAARLDRLLLILALAYLLLCGFGLIATQKFSPAHWCSNNHEGTCSVFVIGQQMLARLPHSDEEAFAAFLAATVDAVGKWG